MADLYHRIVSVARVKIDLASCVKPFYYHLQIKQTL